VPYDETEMQNIRDTLNTYLPKQGSSSEPLINSYDVSFAINSLEAGKFDGNSGLSTDHFINACDELAIPLSLLFSALLVHGFAPSDMTTCTESHIHS